MTSRQILILYLLEGSLIRLGIDVATVKETVHHAVQQYGIEIVLEAFIGFENSPQTKSLQSFLYVLRSYKNQ